MATCRIDDYLRYGVEPFLQAPLLSKGRLPTRLPAWLRDIPDAAYVLLEFRLGEAAETVDLCWGYEPRALSRPTGVDHAPWPAVEQFSRRWVDKDPTLDGISSVVFEADESHDRAVAPPAIFFTINEGKGDAYPRLVRRLGEIFALPFPAALDIALQRCIEAAPRDTAPAYVGLMVSRPEVPVRVGIRVGGRSDIQAYLRAIDWPGPFGPLSDFLDGMADRFDDLAPYIAFDVRDRVGPRVGLEYIFGEPEPGSGSSAAAVLDHLVELGLCTPSKRDAMLAWPGVAVEKRTNETASWAARFVAAGSADCFHRRLAHLKIVFEPSGTSAKGYLDCSHSLIRPA